MKRVIIILITALCIAPAGLVPRVHADADPEDAVALKRKAYELFERGQLDQSAEAFHGYVAARPADTQAIYDYANLLAQLNRNAEAIELLETVHRLDPKNEAAYFKLGTQYVIVHRNDQAAAVFAELQQSTNPDLVKSAAAAAAALKADEEREARAKAEQNVYDLAKAFKYDEVIAAVSDMEKQGELSYGMALQRIYAYSNQQKYAPALALADPLAVKYPKATDLMLVRAELLIQLGREPEGSALLDEVQRENPGSDDAKAAAARAEKLKTEKAAAAGDQAAAAALAAQQPAGSAPAAAASITPSDEAVIYGLADKRQYREEIAAIDELEKKRGSLEWNMQMQRLYALQSVGDLNRASNEAGKMAAEQPNSVELAMMQADLLSRQHRWHEASIVLKDVRAKNPNTPIAAEADRRLAEVPAVENEDKWNWGESFNSGDYHSRFGVEVGYGYLRTGTYIPGVRWLQPYAGISYVVDSRSGTSGTNGLGTVLNDNSVSLFGGIRAQLFPTEYLFLYAQVGGNRDLLGRRSGGWRPDWQMGIYGYKLWGPGGNWISSLPTNGISGSGTSSLAPTWRGDWWVDVDGDFSYYDRFARDFSSWLGYSELREGLRLFQLGDKAAVDAYLLQDLDWDLKGNYTDNAFDVGPGVRLVYVPWRNWQVVLRTEWVQGWYLGRDYHDSKGSTRNAWDDFRAGLSVGVNW